MLLVPKEAYNYSGLLNIGDSSKSRNNTSIKILELYMFVVVESSLSSLCLSSMIKALTAYLVYYELKSATINDSFNLSIN